VHAPPAESEEVECRQHVSSSLRLQ
jgi:hypothetical protein